METTENTLNGFDVFEGMTPEGVLGNIKQGESADPKEVVSGLFDSPTDEELEAIKNSNKGDDAEDDDEEPVEKPKRGRPKKEEPAEEPAEEFEEDEPTDDEPAGEPTEEDESEKNIVRGFFNTLAEGFNWDIDEDSDELPSTAEELVSYISETIKENSKPAYASEDIAKLDEFVKNGGNLRDFYAIDKEVDLETLDVKNNDHDQKLVIREFLKEKGFTPEQIKRKIEKYDAAGLLEDEALDSIEALAEIRESKKQALLEAQKTYADQTVKQQRENFNAVVKQIEDVDAIMGIKIAKQDKPALINYIFRTTSTGRTKYQEDYMKAGPKALIESAYLLMKGETLIDAAKKEGKKTAIDSFKKSLRGNNVTKSKKQPKASTDDMFSTFVSKIRPSH